MHPRTSVLVSIVVSGALLAAVPGPGIGQAAPLERSLAQSGGDSACLVVAQKSASPRMMLLGETTRLTMRVMASCAGDVYPLHIVLVLDRSYSMFGQKIQALKQAAATMVRRLQLAENPATKIGIVGFNHTAQTYADLTNEENKAIGGVNRMQAAGNTAIDRGIIEGMRVLVRGRDAATSAEGIYEVMVVLSDGLNNAGPGPVLSAARQAKSQHVLVIAICVGNDCDTATMRQVATSPRYYFEVERAEEIVDVFERIRQMVHRIVLKGLSVKDVLPDNMRYVPGSAEPDPNTLSPGGDVLEWSTSMVPEGGVTYTLLVEPLQAGHWPTNVEGSLAFVDSKDRTGAQVFEVPWVTVLQPEPVATPTLPPPPPSPTPVPPSSTPSPTGTVSPTPTATPTPRPRPVYLPILVWHPCLETAQYADVALVLDMSTSMSRLTPTGVTKLAATLEAARQFVGLLHLEPGDDGGHDRVAIVGFNADAWIELPLSANLAEANAALDRIAGRQAEFTRTDLALIRGRQALIFAPEFRNNTLALILLTDGLPNRVPPAADGTMETTVLSAAALAKGDGIRVYTIAIGAPEDTHEGLLKSIATTETMYYYGSDPNSLAEIYAGIARTIRCPTDRFGWPGTWP